MKLSNFASKTANFAHLLGLAEAKAKSAEEEDKKSSKAEDEDDKQRDDESDDDYAKRMEEKEKSKDDENAESDKDNDDDTLDDDKKDSKKSKKAEDDDSASAERVRCAKIIAHGIATGSVRQAAIFAFDTDLTASQAINALKASAMDGKSRSTGLRERMAAVELPNVGIDAPAVAANPNDPAVIASKIIDAGKKARGEK